MENNFINRSRLIHNNYYDYSKVNYKNSIIKVCITCPKHGDFWQIPKSHLRGNGCPKCKSEKNKKIIYGFGINDYNKSVKVKNRHIYSYSLWRGIIRRGYDNNVKVRQPTYQDCSVCDEWKYFSNFKHWFDENYVEGYVLDKDILVKGNKVYSPETCCFVPEEINVIFTKRQRYRGKYPIGVHKDRKSYIASVSQYGTKKYIGSFKTEKEAYNAYKKAKELYIKEVADKYFQCGKISERLYNSMYNYKVEEND